MTAALTTVGAAAPARLRHELTVHPQVRALLREYGLRCTRQRLAVLRVVTTDGSHTHLTAAAVHDALVSAGEGIDLTTVYRTLGTLTEVGLLHAIATTGPATCYGLATRPHHHALCVRCGRVAEIPAGLLSGTLDQARRASHYALDDSSVTLRGLCPQCQPSRLTVIG